MNKEYEETLEEKLEQEFLLDRRAEWKVNAEKLARRLVGMNLITYAVGQSTNRHELLWSGRTRRELTERLTQSITAALEGEEE